MRLNNIKNEPVKIISFTILTLMLFYFTIGNILASLAFTALSMWFCTMPRLEFENSFYKNKLPKFLMKKDFINIVIRILIPLVLSILFIMSYSSETTFFESPLRTILMLSAPLVVSIMHGTILNKYECEWDWITPIIASILTVIGVEFVVGNIGNFMQNLFPVFFGKPTDIGILWAFLLQVFLVYAFYRIISIILPGRTIAMFTTSFVFILFGFLHHMFTTHIGKSFFVGELFNIKQAIALIKIVVVENFDMVYVIKTCAVLLVITVITHLLNKETSVYAMTVRVKSFCCGILVLAVVILCSNNFYAGGINAVDCDKTYGYTYYMMNNITAKNTYDAELQNKIDETAKNLFESNKDNTESGSESNTKNENEHSDFTIGE